jgi:hypothetical protein
MSNRKSIGYRWLPLLAACGAAPFVFILVQGYVARLVGPALATLGVSSPAGLRTAVASMNAVGAIFAAALVCVPLGWVAQESAAFFGVVVGAVGSAALAWVWLSVPIDSIAWLRTLELATYLVGCVVASIAGARGARAVAA